MKLPRGNLFRNLRFECVVGLQVETVLKNIQGRRPALVIPVQSDPGVSRRSKCLIRRPEWNSIMCRRARACCPLGILGTKRF
jgi:hypothetical protein